MAFRTLAFSTACTLGLTGGAFAQSTPANPSAPPAATTTAPPAAPAAMAAPAHIRGTIDAVAPHLLKITGRDGSKLEVTLTDPLTVTTLKHVPLSSIKDNAYLGIASKPGSNNTRIALEVLVFPESMRGVGPGHYAWDLQPDSMMTNAPVTGVAKAKSGRDLTLSYQGGTVTVHVPLQAPVVTFVPAAASDLKPGRKVFIIARKDADGHLSAGRVTVGTHGVNPPM